MTDQDSTILSKDLDDCFTCVHCAAQLRSIRKHASSADPQFESDITRLLSDIDSYPDIKDTVLTYLSSFIRRTKRTYKDACIAQESNPVNNRLRESVHTDRQPISTKNTKLLKKHIFNPTMIALGIVVSIIVIVLIAINSGLVDRARMWTCDSCDKTWRGIAYYGLNGDEVLCDKCAQLYWSPLPYKDYQIDSNQFVGASTLSVDYNQPTVEQLQQMREEAKAEGVSEVYWTHSDKSYHFNLDCPYIADKTPVADGGTLYAGSIDDAFADNHWDPCDACAGGAQAKLD